MTHAFVSRLGKQQVDLLKLAGSLVFVVGLLQIIASLALMSDAWDALKNFDNCSPTDSAACAESLYRISGVSVWAGQQTVDATQTIRVLVNPVVQLFWWIIVLLAGIFMQNVSVNQTQTSSHKRK